MTPKPYVVSRVPSRLVDDIVNAAVMFVALCDGERDEAVRRFDDLRVAVAALGEYERSAAAGVSRERAA